MCLVTVLVFNYLDSITKENLIPIAFYNRIIPVTEDDVPLRAMGQLKRVQWY